MMLTGFQGIGVDAELPLSLAEIVGNTYTFQLRLKDFNFTSKYQTFTFPAFSQLESSHLCQPLW